MKYIFLFSIVLLLSCNSGSKSDDQNSDSVDISFDTWILDNQELKSILSDYIHAVDEYSSRENSFIQMWYRAINDSTYSFTLWAWSDINTFVYQPPHILFQFENHLIFFHIFGLDIFRINDDFIVEFMKKNYPDQYKNYYLKVGDYPPPKTGGSLEWELIFQNDSLIKKEIYRSQ